MKKYLLLIPLLIILSACHNNEHASVSNNNNSLDVTLSYREEAKNSLEILITNNTDSPIYIDTPNTTIEIYKDGHWKNNDGDEIKGSAALGMDLEVPANSTIPDIMPIDISKLHVREKYRLHYTYFKNPIERDKPIDVFHEFEKSSH
ncbi:hypothetical protein [Candidatus Enterococcus ikei]|uniref:Lipoprotein n=1 Tax=Candidatus Enterococcus ikei TaxID=2815326 RepID=A0ABS3GZJ2_9ENTE|nr:hypothetical protein [Enterococcus sp. DIV0869a]MBO0440662.1 hypothetical protein [Enterococcus sp. DIV0869a]